MKKLIVLILTIANCVTAILVFNSLNLGYARQLKISDLSYGMIDCNGDGVYSYKDDYVLKWLLENNPNHINEALKTAKFNEDGGIDLSEYLMSFKGNNKNN